MPSAAFTIIKSEAFDFLLKVEYVTENDMPAVRVTALHSVAKNKKSRALVFFYRKDEEAHEAVDKLNENVDQTFNMFYHNVLCLADPLEW